MKKPFITLSVLALALIGCRPPTPLSTPQTSALPSVSRVPKALSGVGLPPEREKELDRVAREGSRAELKAESLFDQGRLEEAEEACEEVNRIYDSSGETMAQSVAHLLGRIRMRQGRYADAVAYMEPNLGSNAGGMSMDLALCHLKVGGVAKARALYEPGFITGYNSAFGDTARYLPDVRTPERLEGAILWTKGVALSNVGRPDEATDLYAAALRLLPRNALLAARLGIAAENAGRHKEAVAAFRIVGAVGDADMRRTVQTDWTTASERAAAEVKVDAKPNG